MTIKQIEHAIAERALDEGWVVPRPPPAVTGRSVAVVGSGPAGLAAAQQLARAGHAVTVFERDDAPGGLLRYGIPDFKLDKRRSTGGWSSSRPRACASRPACESAATSPLDELAAGFDAVVLATGAQRHRDLDLPAASSAGIEHAMPYLDGPQPRASPAGRAGRARSRAAGKRVIVLGGGDTSADCLGYALREGATSVIEIAHGPTPPRERTPLRTWPEWPPLLRSYAVHERGRRPRVGVRDDRRSRASDGPSAAPARRGASSSRTTPRRPPPAGPCRSRAGARSTSTSCCSRSASPASSADGPVYGGSASAQRPRTVAVDSRVATAVDGVFAAGDCVRGADLIVTAIADGREAARAVDRALQGRSFLPAKARPGFVEA